MTDAPTPQQTEHARRIRVCAEAFNAAVTAATDAGICSRFVAEMHPELPSHRLIGEVIIWVGGTWPGGGTAL